MKKITTLLALLFVINWASAQVDVVEPAQAAPSSDVKPQASLAPTADDNSLLWEISGNYLKTPSYLYGTIHMIGKEDFFLTDKTKETFGKSEKIVFEIDMNKMNDMSVMFSLIGQVMMKDGLSLKDLLNEEDYKLVSDHFTAMGLPMFMFEKVKPMFLASMASGDMSGGGSGDMASGGMASGDIVSYEMEFMEMAKTQEKEMDGLETIAYQMSVFDSIPYEDQAKMLVESISSEVAGDSQFDEMVEMYKRQDLSGMQEMFAADEEGIGKYEDVFLKNRNENWIPVMKEMMAVQPTFFAVGAGHLGGDIGVIALLRKAGYEVKALY